MSHWLIFGRVNLNFSDLENMIFTPAIRRVYVESTCKNPLEPHSSTPYCKEELLATGIKVARRICTPDWNAAHFFDLLWIMFTHKEATCTHWNLEPAGYNKNGNVQLLARLNLLAIESIEA